MGRGLGWVREVLSNTSLRRTPRNNCRVSVSRAVGDGDETKREELVGRRRGGSSLSRTRAGIQSSF